MIDLNMISHIIDKIIKKSSLMNNVNFNVNRVKDRKITKFNSKEALNSM